LPPNSYCLCVALFQILGHIGRMSQVVADRAIHVCQRRRRIILNDRFRRRAVLEGGNDHLEQNSGIADADGTIRFAAERRIFGLKDHASIIRCRIGRYEPTYLPDFTTSPCPVARSITGSGLPAKNSRAARRAPGQSAKPWSSRTIRPPGLRRG